jgi:hypothetical protein
MILNPSLAKLVIALGLVLVLGPFRLHAEQRAELETVAAANIEFEHALAARDINAMEGVGTRDKRHRNSSVEQSCGCWVGGGPEKLEGSF